MKQKLLIFFTILNVIMVSKSWATGKLELDKQTCRWFYRPDNTYSINYQIDIYNRSTAGESLKNIQVSDNMATTFGGASRIVSTGIYAIWTGNTDSGSAYPSGAWDWNWSNTTNWNGTTVTNLLNDGSSGNGETIANLTLVPGGYIHLELCVVVKAANLTTGIGSNGSWTNTLNFVSAKTTANVNLTAGSLVNTYTPSITNIVTVSPFRNRSIITTELGSNVANEATLTPALNGTWSFDYYIKVKQHPNTTPNPDGASGATTNSFVSHLDLGNFYSNGMPINSATVTKEYGPASFVPNPNYTGGATTVGGSSVTANDNLLASNSTVGLNDSALLKVHLVLGPSQSINQMFYLSAWSEWTDAGGVYQSNTSGEQDTLNDPYDQCKCWGRGIQFNYQKGITVTKSVLSNVCTAGQLNKMDIEYQFIIKADSAGNVWLHNISLTDDMATNSCGSFVSIVSPPSITASTANTPPSVNTAFNGNSVTDLLSGSANDKLGPNETVTVKVTARYSTTSMCSPNQYNTGTIAGTDPAGNTAFFTTANVLIPAMNCSTPTCVTPNCKPIKSKTVQN